MFLVVTTILLGALGYAANGLPTEKAVFDEQLILSSSRILGGTDAPKGYAPHMVALVYGEVVPLLVCGGSIVSRRHVLTAAHCIAAVVNWEGNLLPSLRGVIGSNKFDSTRNTIIFTDFINHPEYNPGTIKNDIGVLFVSGKIRLSERVAIVALSYEWVGKEECYVTGWGNTWVHPQTNHLQKLYVDTMTPEECTRALDNAWFMNVDHDIEICTFHSFGHGMCHGDSGSGLVSKKTGQQVGIVSWGIPCALGYPDMFVRISGFAHWLQSILKGK